MKILITILILSISFLFSMGKVDTTVTWVELPDRGTMYDIKEEDMDVTFKNALAKYLKTHNIKQEIIDSIKETKTSKININRCSKSETINRESNYKIKDDIKLPSGKILVKKGTKPKMLMDIAFDFCIFDGSNDKENDLLMKKFPKNCVFLVNHRDIDYMTQRYNKKFYPLSSFIKNKLDLKCLPVKINFFKNKEKFQYIKIKDLRDENNNN